MDTSVKNNSVISMNNILMDFGITKALKGISFNIKHQNIFGLLGPSGAGKTTILKILIWQLRPTYGEAFVNVVNSITPNDDIYSKIGLALDTLGLYDRLSCWHNLYLFEGVDDFFTWFYKK